MRKTMFASMVLSALLAAPAMGSVQQPTPEQRRDIQKRLGELEQEMRDLRRQLGDDGRVRTRVWGPEIMRIGPGGEVLRLPGGRLKFGFGFQAVADSGVKVTTVTPGSPAEKVGLKAGDIVTMFNGVKLTGMTDADATLQRQAQDLEVGDTVNVEFRRGNDRRSGKMVAEDLGPNPRLNVFPDSAFRSEMPKIKGEFPGVIEWGAMPGRWLDMELVSLDKDLGEYFGAPDGVLVVRAPKDNSLGLHSGDVILSIDGRKPSTPPQALRILRSYEPGESYEVVVLRMKKKVTLTGKIPDSDPRGYYYGYETPSTEK